mmetsp:Transcript_17290/g.55051  ORF Transcript_17290/g.55051 Transcript_17290/m.55051 type:complete len:99 (+) Transcript_17290:188-484(+)
MGQSRLPSSEAARRGLNSVSCNNPRVHAQGETRVTSSASNIAVSWNILVDNPSDCTIYIAVLARGQVDPVDRIRHVSDDVEADKDSFVQGAVVRLLAS